MQAKAEELFLEGPRSRSRELLTLIRVMRRERRWRAFGRPSF